VTRRAGPVSLAAAALAACAGPAARPVASADAGAASQGAEHAVSPPVDALPDAGAPPRADHPPGRIRPLPSDGGAAEDR
jgi:hypothetical protein